MTPNREHEARLFALTPIRQHVARLLAQIAVAERRSYSHAHHTGRDVAQGQFLVLLLSLRR